MSTSEPQKPNPNWLPEEDENSTSATPIEHPYGVLVGILKTCDAILQTINKMLEEDIKLHIETLKKFDKIINVLESKPTQTLQKKTEQPTSTEQKQQEQEHPKVKEIKEKLGAELSSMLNFDSTTSSTFIIIKPRQYLGSDNFGKIASVIKAMNGQYVSQGKESHFRVSKGE